MRIKSMVLVLLLWPFVSLNIPAQTGCPASTLDECPATGCGGWDKELNARKNFIPGESDATKLADVTLDEIKRLAYPEMWPTGKGRDELKALGEGRYVRVGAYLIDAEQEAPQPANCLLPGAENTNLKLSLISEEDLRLPREQRAVTSVTAEITPRAGRIYKTSWTLNKNSDQLRLKVRLDRLIEKAPFKALRVRVTGILLLDTEHIYHRLVRYTDWEIHPVLNLEVCRQLGDCAEDADWEWIEDVVAQIKRKHNVKKTTKINKDRIK